MTLARYESFVMDQTGVLHRLKSDDAIQGLDQAYQALRSAACVQRVLADQSRQAHDYRFYLGLIFEASDLVEDGECWDPEHMEPVQTIDLLSGHLLN